MSSASAQSPLAHPTITTTYIVNAVSTVGGCPALPQQIKVTVVDPFISIEFADSAICLGNSLVLQVIGDPTFQYNWSPAAGLNDPTLMEPTASPVVPTTYTVTATVPVLGCTTTASIDVVLLPQVFAHATPPVSVCLKQSIELAADPGGSQYTYLWNGPGGFTSFLQFPFIRYAQPGNEGIYSVTVTDITTGCKGIDTTYVKVGNDSLALIDVTPDQTIRYGSSIQLNASNAVKYTWTPNDGTLDNPNINNPIATPLERTTYIVYAVGPNGCIDVDTVVIDVTDVDDVFIPSGFTPNGDGRNDVFRVSGRRYFKLVEMSVFNRWGEIVYHAEGGDNEGWDGSFKGAKADMGTYSYMIVLGKADNTAQSYKGNVTLIR